MARLQLRELATKRNITLSELQRRTGLSMGLVRRYWYNEGTEGESTTLQKVNLHALDQFAHTLDVNVSDLIVSDAAPADREPRPTTLYANDVLWNMRQRFAHIVLPPTTRPGNRVYRGVHLMDGEVDYSWTVWVDDQPLVTALGWDPERDRFTWGYGGSGPSALAYGMLTYEYGRDVAKVYCERFSDDVIEQLPKFLGGVEWVLETEQIHLWWRIAHAVDTIVPNVHVGPITNRPLP